MNKRKSTTPIRLLAVILALSWVSGQAFADSQMQKAWTVIEQALQNRSDGGPLFDLYVNQLKTNPASPAYLFPVNLVPPGAMGFNPVVNYTLPNWSQSPNIRKFVDSLPGLGAPGCKLGTATAVPPYSDGTCGQNNLGQYIPVALPDFTSYPGSAYYEINAGNYLVQMNSDLPQTALRGYFQVNAPLNPEINNVKQYLGPAIVARVWDPNKPAGGGAGIFGVGGNGWPVRLKIQNELPVSSAASSCTTSPGTSPKLCLPVDTVIMGAGMGPLTAAGATCDSGTIGANCALFTENRITEYHLHGGRTPWISDGTPHQWFTPANDPIPSTAGTGNPWGMAKGPAFQNVPDMVNGSVVNGTAVACKGGTKCFTPSAKDGLGTQFFSNEQSARLMFYHDHVWGITRLNVYKGLAAPYLLIDNVEDDLIDGSNTSGKNTWGASVLPSQPWGGAALRYGIPLVIQDKSFVNDASVNSQTILQARGFPLGEYAPTEPTYITGCASGTNTLYLTATASTQCGTDPLWEKYVGSTGGQLWLPHEYMPVENIYDPTGNTTNGRWDYGPFLIPPMVPTNLTLPSPTITPEAFMDTMVVNGTAFPYVNLPPDVVRFRILSVGNDRVLNLQLYKADPLTIRLTNRGSGYAVPPAAAPAVSLSGGGTTPATATATAAVVPGPVTLITLTAGGSGYASAPACSIADTPPGIGTGATCTAALTGGVVTTVGITAAGTGYSAPVVSLTGGFGSGTADVSAGVITDIAPARDCAGFNHPPTVTITPNAADTTAKCSQPVSAIVMWNSNGQVTGFQGLIDATGAYACTGFNNPPSITISDGLHTCIDSGALVVPAGQLLDYNITAPANFTSVPTVSIAPPPAGGTPATAIAVLATEVSMVPAAPNQWYPTWPWDGRDGGVPDPTTQGPPWIQIGNEGGLLAQANIIPQQPIDYEYIRQNIPFAGVTSHSLLLLPAQRADVLVDLRGYTPGDTLILYNDAAAPMPMFWPFNDYYTDDPDQRAVGGAPTTPPGFGPNTRTVMQIRIVPFPVGTSAFQGTSSAQAYQSLVAAAIPKAFAVANDPPIVNQIAYNAAYPSGPHHATADLYVQAPDSTINLTNLPQPIARIRTVAPGNNCTIAPKVSIIGDSTVAATAVAGLNPAGALTLLTAGSGYTAAPTCAIGAPNACTAATGCIQATCVATVSGGVVNAIQVNEPGAGYSSVTAPTCTLGNPQGAGGVLATCSAFVATLNTVGSITVTNPPGVGYTREPRVYITPAAGNPTCIGATAVALLNGLGGTGTPASALTYGVMTGKSITEGFDPDFGRLDIRMGSTPNPLTPTIGAGMVMGLARYIDPPTEILNDGDPIVWRISHLGVDSHALHFHLYDVQIVNRVDWTNVVKPPYPDELGWRDTMRTNPFEDYIVAFRPHAVYLPFPVPSSNRLLDPSTPVNSTTNFLPIAPPAGVGAVPQVTNLVTNFGWEYVWHCHMLEHEENDFMRAQVFTVSPPAAPASLTATVASGAVNLSWNGHNTNAVDYFIERATSTSFSSYTSLHTYGSPPPTTYADQPPAGGTYYYRVRAENSAGVSGWSNTTPGVRISVVTPPTNLAATLQTGPAVRLTWTSGTNATSMTVQRNDWAAPVTLAANATSYTDSTVTLGNTYSYKVCEINPAAIGSPACATSSPITVAGPAAPSNVKASAARANGNKDTLTVTWTDNSNNESGFTIRWSTSSTFATGVSTGTAGAIAGTGGTGTFTTNVPRGLTLYIQVQATNPVGSSSWVSAASSVTTP